MEIDAIKNDLASLWRIPNSWQLIPLGRVLRDILIFISPKKKKCGVCGGGETCTLQFGLFRLS